MSTKSTRFAVAASRRVTAEKTGVAKALIETILAALVPVLLERLTNCLPAKQQKNATPELLQKTLEVKHNRDPKTVRDISAKDAMKVARKQGERITKADAYKFADAAIQEGLHTTELDWSL